MTNAAEQDPGFTVSGYFALVEQGYLEADDHVELLEGLVVASPPRSPLHASVIMRVDAALRTAVGERASIRVQMPLIAGPRSVPEPDIALVAGGPDDYRESHPEHALLVVEVSDSSLPHDRLTKSRVYAKAGVVEYWIVNLRERRIEVHTTPDAGKRVYKTIRDAEAGDVIELAALPGARVPVAELLADY
jgi:Uma2 family endonuclease